MSQPGRPPPENAHLMSNELENMAQTQRAMTFPSSQPFYGRPLQQIQGPQLPPINNIPSTRSAHDNEGRCVQLPPMRIPLPAVSSPANASSPRSIPVSHLLSANPPSPSRPQPTTPAQQTLHRQSDQYSNSHMEHWTQPLSYQATPSHRLDHTPVPFRQPQPFQTFQQPPPQQYQRPQYSTTCPSTGSEQIGAHQYSPTISGYSSPISYNHSEASPRSSLAPPSKPRVIHTPPLDFTLSIRQQPVAARACGFGERDRRVIDPPPILELKITDRLTGFPEQDPNGMLALHCTLLSPDGSSDETELASAHPDVPTTRRLMGSTVASPYQAKDEKGNAGTFFVFPDLSCRSPGRYRLRFRLLRVDSSQMQLGATHGNVAKIITDVFNVYTAKDFPGMRASSGLLKALRRQGLNVGVKKGSESRKGKTKAKKEAESSASSSDEDEDSDLDARGTAFRNRPVSGGISPKSKERQKGKRRKRDC